MLGSAGLVAFVPTVDLDRAGEFYGDLLGLRRLSSDGFAAVFDAGGTPVRVTRVEEVTPAPYTVLGWTVDDISTAVADLRARGVEFVVYDGMDQDDDGVWASPGGARIAWFRDPDGNTLSLTQE